MVVFWPNQKLLLESLPVPDGVLELYFEASIILAKGTILPNGGHPVGINRTFKETSHVFPSGYFI